MHVFIAAFNPGCVLKLVLLILNISQPCHKKFCLICKLWTKCHFSGFISDAEFFGLESRPRANRRTVRYDLCLGLGLGLGLVLLDGW